MAAAPAVLPRPASMTAGDGALALPGATLAWTRGDAGAERAARRFRDLLQRSQGPTLAIRGEGASIRFERARDASLPDEGYRIAVDARQARVTARTDAGLQHGATTLWQLATDADGAASIPAVRIEDAPRLRWRGLLLDSARHYQSPAFIRTFLDAMAAHKLNVLHWHLTDDQAWRLEIRKYPKLTQVGAWRVPAGAAPREDIDARTGKPRRIGGSYSQREVRDIVRYAQALGITIVPEIDMPGHATAAMVAYPALAAIDDPPREVPADWGVYTHLYSLEESTFRFIEDVLAEVIALFPSPSIHVGGDEVLPEEWSATPRARDRLRALGIDSPAKAQPYFTQRLGRFLASKGRRLVGWDEILVPGLAPDAVVMSWRGTEGAREAAKMGYDTVVAAHPTLYFDNRQSASRREPPGRIKVVSLRDVYEFDPVPQGLDAAQARHVLGIQGNIWTEHTRTEERVAVMAFPRAAAIAELGWTAGEARDWPGFRRRVDAMLARYSAIGLEAAAAAERMRAEPLPAPSPMRRTAHELQLCSEHIAIGLEDDAPRDGPRAVFPVDIQHPCWLYRDAPLDRARAIRARVGQVPFNFRIGEDVKKITFPPSAAAGGELQVRRAGCEGEVVARLPLAPARGQHAVTQLPAVALPPGLAPGELCLRFAQVGVDPIWTLDEVELLEAGP